MYRQVNTRLWWNKSRAGRRQSAGRCYIWTDIYRRGGARGHILGFVLQNFPCKPDQRSVKEDKGERRRWMPTSCHTLWFVPLPCFIANPSIWLGTQSPCSSFLDHHLPPSVLPPSGFWGRFGCSVVTQDMDSGLAPHACTLLTTPHPSTTAAAAALLQR